MIKRELIAGYEEIINELLEKHKIKQVRKIMINSLIKSALNDESFDELAIRMLIDGGDFIYED